MNSQQNHNTSTSVMKFQQENSLINCLDLAQRNNTSTFNEKNSSSLEKGEETRFRFQVVLGYDYALLTFLLFNIALAWIYYQADYLGKQKIVIRCLYLMEITQFLSLVIVTIFRYKAKVMLQKSQKILEEQESLCSSGKIYELIFQIIVVLIKPYTFLNTISIQTSNIYDNFQFSYKLNYIFVVLGFIKIFIAFRVLLMRQLYMSPRCNYFLMHGQLTDFAACTDHNQIIYMDSPIELIMIVFVISVGIFSICLRIAQRNLAIQYPKYFNGKPYTGSIENFENAIWLTIITMTTVGYGDLYPRTLFGRIIDIVLVIWGSFIVSLMVVVVTNTLNMEQAEKRALIVLNRLEAKKSLKQAAAYLITHSCRKYLINKSISQHKRGPLSQSQRYNHQKTFYKYLSNFQNVHRSIRSMYEIDDVYEQMTRQFEVINDQISQLLATQQSTLINLEHKQSSEDKSNDIIFNYQQDASINKSKDISVDFEQLNSKWEIDSAFNISHNWHQKQTVKNGKSRFKEQSKTQTEYGKIN